MKSKLVLALMLLSAVVFSGTTQLKAEDPAAAQSAPESQDKPIKAIGVIIVNPNNNANVVLLTNIQIKGNTEPKLIAIPVTLDENGKKLTEEYGIIGMRPDVEGDEVRVREEAEKKAV